MDNNPTPVPPGVPPTTAPPQPGNVPPAKGNKTIIWLLVGVVVFLLLGVGVYMFMNRQKANPPATTEPVTQTNSQEPVKFSELIKTLDEELVNIDVAAADADLALIDKDLQDL